MAAISFDNVSFAYDGANRALDGVSLVVPEGEFLCIIGGNGSGKSTLAKLVNALLTPDEGKVLVLGRDTSDPANTFFIRGNAGMVFQNPDDQIIASIVENDVAFGPENLGIPNPELRGRVTHALQLAGLPGFERRETASLSGGQKQRVALAGVLAMQPRILVLDEAGAMLDPRGRAGLLRICQELHDDGLTIVLITHFMEEAALADRIVVLDGGRVALAGTPDEVLAQPELLERLSLEAPFAVRLSRALQERGVPVGMHVDATALEEDVASLLGTCESSAGGDSR